MTTQKLFQTLVAIAALVFAFTFTSCAEDDTPVEPTPMNLVEKAQDLGFSQLAAALTEAGLVDVIANTDNLTVFAPSNDAFDKFLSDNNFATFADVPDALLENTLKYHVLGEKRLAGSLENGYLATLDASGPEGTTVNLLFNNDNGAKLNGSVEISSTDTEASNGVIHVINAVLTRPSVVGHAIANDDFSILVEAVIKAELVDALSAAGPFTVFAPTNAAFERLFEDLQVNGIEDLTKEQLDPILKYHVVSGNIREDAVVSLITGGTTTVGTLNTMADLNLAIVDGGVVINEGSNVVATNVQGVNGVVHVINKVLVP